MKTPRIHIIGAGVSGLVCALELERMGFAPVIIEASDDVGGRLKTDMHEGIPLDHGFQVMLTAYPAVRRYLDIETLDLRSFRPGAVVFKGGKRIRFGDFTRDGSFFPATLTAGIATIKDKVNTYFLSKRLRSKENTELFEHSPGTTMGYLHSKGFSQRMIDSFFVPFYGGIFLEKALKTPASMFAFTFKMFSSGSAAIPRKGIYEIAAQLREQLSSTAFKFDTAVDSVKTGEIRLANGEILDSDVVIWTCPPRDLEPEITWRSCTTYYFLTKENVLNDHIIGLLPNAKVVNTIHYVTDLMKDNDIDGHILSATVVGQTDATIDAVLEDLREECKIDAVEHIKTYKVEYALPDLTMAKYAPEYQDIKVMQGVYRAGDTMANASLNAAMESGRVAARAVMEDLSDSTF